VMMMMIIEIMMPLLCQVHAWIYPFHDLPAPPASHPCLPHP
jgi:hypothetical protein